MPGIAMANQEERRHKTSTTTKRKAYNKTRRAVLYSTLLVAFVSFSYLFVNRNKTPLPHQRRKTSKSDIKAKGRQSDDSDPFRVCKALYGELVESPHILQYHSSFASSISQMFRIPVHALMEEAFSGLDKIKDEEDCHHGQDRNAGNILVQVDSLLRKSVLLAAWEKLSIIASASGREQDEHGRITEREALRLQWWANSPGVARVCEIGFNMGHSAVSILLGNPLVSLFTVEIREDPWVKHVQKAVQGLFQERFQLRYGNSLSLIPELARTSLLACNLFRVDGDHRAPAPDLDLHNALLTLEGPSLVWMDDVGCTGCNCEQPTRAWRRAVEQGEVEQIECEIEDKTHGYCVGRATSRVRAR